MIELKISKSPQVILIFRSEFGPEVAFWLEHVYRLSSRLEIIFDTDKKILNIFNISEIILINKHLKKYLSVKCLSLSVNEGVVLSKYSAGDRSSVEAQCGIFYQILLTKD